VARVGCQIAQRTDDVVRLEVGDFDSGDAVGGQKLTDEGYGDADTFKSVPGIGVKTARRIIAELSDAKLISDESVPGYQNEALLALEALGFKREKIVKILPDLKSTSTSELVKEALKKLA